MYEQRAVYIWKDSSKQMNRIMTDNGEKDIRKSWFKLLRPAIKVKSEKVIKSSQHFAQIKKKLVRSGSAGHAHHENPCSAKCQAY